LPVRLIDADHRFAEHVLFHSRIGRCEKASDRAQLVPESLRVDHEAISEHRAYLALEREVVSVLGHRNVGRKGCRIPRSCEELERSGGGLDAAAAGALVLLATVLLDNETSLDDVDFLGVLEEAFARLKMPAAQVARLVLDGRNMDLLDDLQRRLLAAPMASLFGLVPRGLALALGLLTLVTEEEFVATRKLLFELGDLKLKL